MKQFYLAEIVTKDKLVHQGVYFEPPKKGKRAILYVHGLSSVFYNEPVMTETFADACEKEGMGFASFNTRGHDMLAGIRKRDGTAPYGYSYAPGGAAQEVFEQSVLDIEAGIDFLVARGYKEIVLVGHSTGANKVCYFAGTQKNPHVAGVVLSGPISDRLGAPKSSHNLAHMRKLVREGRGDELVFGYHFFPLTPKRFLSLFEPGSTEDVFDYGDENPRLTYFSNISIPLLVVLSGKDEAADRPVTEIQKIYDSRAAAPKYKSVIIPGALHRYNGNEKQAVAAIVDWIKTL